MTDSLAKRKRFVVLDADGIEVDGHLYDSRTKAMNGPWSQAIVECGYSVKRVNLFLYASGDGYEEWVRTDEY